ncbi:Pentatricopeptide repeat [Macleaya cordata]|uniref:Pentatricopeptide repeat n=1 Tax=Macleaya cordata TaxID=56857 RepID=A0A200PUU8_MACCD|nr:Pentatricopeptide repeat [Macleaya cordata]
MTQQGIQPDLITYSVLLKSCIRSRDFNRGKLIHACLVESELEFDTVVLNSLISLYSKCGDWKMANSIFGEMGSKRDLVSWSAMISCFAHNHRESEAVITFYKMLEHGQYPNEFCFAGVIHACSKAEFGWIGKVIFGFVIKTGYFEADLCVGCALIDMYVKSEVDLVSARRVFDEMPVKNVVVWTLMITRYTQCGFARDAIDLFLDMELSEFTPDMFTFSNVISACAELGYFQLGQQLHSRAIRSGLAMDVCVGCSLVDMYSKCANDGSVDDSRKVFDRMPYHNVMSWTAIITGYVQSGGGDFEAIDLFCKMLQGEVRPNHFTFSSVLKACANLGDKKMGEQTYCHVVKLGLASVNCVGNSVISMYAKSGSMEEARKAFDILFEKNLVSYNTIVDGYTKNFDPEEAFQLFNQIENTGMGVSSFTFASLLSGAASIGSIGKGEQLHARLLKVGFNSDQCINNALISMYSRCGNIEAASKIFSEMEDKNVISWTSMITGFAKHGFAKKALEMFHKMIKTGIKPNEVTYVAVLSACSHVGLVAEGWENFKSMEREHRISPRMEHFACMVDLLGRSGLLDEALDFIYTMPFQADSLVWRTLLGACRVHENMEIGKLAAKQILELEPNDPAAYILLSNLYASSGQWKDVVDIRKNMKERKLTKEAGCSWIEIENKVHKFFVGDTAHPRAEEIFAELDRLGCKIKDLGYVPNTDFVLHDVEEEQKEQYLFQHSEKLALAFGLISTSGSRPIRIFKNLRVCGDCHSAMKFVSIATKREIVVRDSNRFHHIKDGKCSCNDYW